MQVAARASERLALAATAVLRTAPCARPFPSLHQTTRPGPRPDAFRRGSVQPALGKQVGLGLGLGSGTPVMLASPAYRPSSAILRLPCGSKLVITWVEGSLGSLHAHPVRAASQP
eukprot:scaffold236_cov419-Prasinococcus_capsulatus_cf.AAC.32